MCGKLLAMSEILVCPFLLETRKDGEILYMRPCDRGLKSKFPEDLPCPSAIPTCSQAAESAVSHFESNSALQSGSQSRQKSQSPQTIVEGAHPSHSRKN